MLCLLLNVVFFIDVESTEVLCNWKEELPHFVCLISEDVKSVYKKYSKRLALLVSIIKFHHFPYPVPHEGMLGQV